MPPRFQPIAAQAATEDQRWTLRVQATDPDAGQTVRYELAPVAGGTEVAIRATGSPGRFFGWAKPLMNAQVRRSIAADLARLRGRLDP